MADFYPDMGGGGDTGDTANSTDKGTPPEGGTPNEEQKPDEQKPEGETALVPKGLLGGKEFQPGEEVVFKIVRFHGDEVEVAYATGESEKEEGGMQKSGMEDAQEKMAAYGSG